jgi:CheY-like chemotaxis protein
VIDVNTPSPDKINVLVVDDDPSWWQPFEDQSKTLSSSFVDIKTSSSFQEGLARLNDDDSFDIVLVDLFLDHDQLAFDFIEKAKKQGHFLPYVITSQQVKKTALSSKDRLEQYLSLNVADYIEKRELKRLSTLQDRLRERLNDFLNTLSGLLNLYFTNQIGQSEKTYLLSHEISALSMLLLSYSGKIKNRSFNRICHKIRDLSDQNIDSSLTAFAGAPFSEPDIVRLKLNVSSPEGSQSPLLLLEDFIPYHLRTRALQATVRRLQRLGAEENLHIERIKSSIYDLLKLGHDFDAAIIERIVLQLALYLTLRKRVDMAVDTLYFLSQLYAKEGKSERIPLIDLMIANILFDNNQSADALPYIRSAKKAISALKVDSLKPVLDAALYFARGHFASPAAQRLIK